LSANLYHTGTEGMGWHSDAEKNLKKNGAIASVSFAERKFTFKHRDSKETVSGTYPRQLVSDEDETQTHWQHRLPPLRITTPRVSYSEQ
jgi:alkylated DNA repair dioxygenase AlkB